MIDIVGLTGSVEIDEPEEGALHLGAEQPTTGPGAPLAQSPALARGVRRVKAIPAGDDVIDATLRWWWP
ncbi:MAG: hypothetical protein ACRDWW_07340, partial [Acidimicrobiales bacterium]